MTESDLTPLPVPEKISRYKILQELGRGGMAAVYLAHDPNFDRQVAIKVLPHELLLNPVFRTRFQREARAIAALEHRAIVPVYDFGEEHGQPFLVMRYLNGGSLAQRIRSGPVPVAEVAKILGRLGSALDAAHAKGIVHRDLKPSNILFDSYGDSFLSDFGIAQLAETKGTLTGTLAMGTPAYMSPEQITGEKTVDGRADIYALGVVLFEMLTGKAPFEAESPAKMMVMHLYTPPPHVPETAAHLPPGINRVLDRSLAKDPDSRYAKASEMSREFAALAAGGEAAAAAEGTPAAAALGAGRNPPAATDVEEASAADDATSSTEVLGSGRDLSTAAYDGEAPGSGGKPRRWIPAAALVAAGACLCLLAGGIGVPLAIPGVRESLQGFFLPATATASSTAAGENLASATSMIRDTRPVPTAAIARMEEGIPLLISNGQDLSIDPRIAFDSKGNAHIFYVELTGEDSSRLVHRALLPDGNLTDPECVSCLSGNPKRVFSYNMIADEQNGVCVDYWWTGELPDRTSVICYADVSPNPPEEFKVVQAFQYYSPARNPEGELKFLIEDSYGIRVDGQRVVEEELAYIHPDFTIDANGGYHLVWINATQPYVVRYRHSADRGATWSDPITLDSNGVSLFFELVLFPGRDGSVHLMIVGDPKSTLYWNGAWTKIAHLEKEFIGYDAVFVEDREGKVSIVGHGEYGDKSGVWIYQTADAGERWLGPTLLVESREMFQLGVSAATGPDGGLYIAYGEDDTTYDSGDIYLVATSYP